MSPAEFEQFVANLFTVQGYKATVVGGACDAGCDVKIHQRTGELWGIAQCKRYAEKGGVSAHQVRGFCGAYMLSGATQGFIFTTGRLTRQAERPARRFTWLKVFNRSNLAQYIEKVKEIQHL